MGTKSETRELKLPFKEDKELLRAISNVRPLYFLPNDPLIEEVLIPAFKAAQNVNCMVGFFSSQALASLAPGLATYINRTQNSFRLIISPFLSNKDRVAIEEGTQSNTDLANTVLERLIITEDILEQHTLRCLSYLLKTKRIEIKVALMKDALFHLKVWVFEQDGDVMAVHGSNNLTHAGICRNFEQISVSCSWQDPYQRYTNEKLQKLFVQLWKNQEDECVVISIPQAIKDSILRRYPVKEPPTEEDFTKLYDKARGFTDAAQENYEPPPLPRQIFHIPEKLRFEDGPYEHQGKAIKAWCDAGYKGVLEMATGSGKTITAMICAHKLYSVKKPLLIVVAAPYVPLIQQWCDEIEPFGLRPVNLTEAIGVRGRARELNRIRRRLRNETNDVAIIVVSHRILCDAGFKAEISKFECARLLIADEAHNLGSEGFIVNPPLFFEYRLGLSATPVRQYDDEGTKALFSFFGDVVFQFTLKEAIGKCLVEYDYYVHPVELTEQEMEKWCELTSKIKANSWRQEDGKPDDYLSKLFRDRRLILETAENKLPKLEAALHREKFQSLKHTLIYASDKAPQQLRAINSLLQEKGVLFHQLTFEETAKRDETARIIKAFQEGTLRVLTAKRVLDEGVNIPQIIKAFILASTTVERQWVQRRGRLLRTCRETGKTHSEIHDFLVLPPNLETIDDEARSLIKSELLRVQEFASLARNAGRPNGPLNLIHKLVHTAFM